MATLGIIGIWFAISVVVGVVLGLAFSKMGKDSSMEDERKRARRLERLRLRLH